MDHYTSSTWNFIQHQLFIWVHLQLSLFLIFWALKKLILFLLCVILKLSWKEFSLLLKIDYLSDKLKSQENWKELLAVKWFVSLTFPIILHILNKRIEIWCWKQHQKNSCSKGKKYLGHLGQQQINKSGKSRNSTL